ncbi:MAG: biotin--[acetyl-CoA-carboxylase] ligase [Bacteroidales bacterium]|jgi:BirA family biotin operon repressor/biotin-[acetyl-CoA-carboxylase] ligase|nr:biotin--[acetyl-CoA-carboxylase] ligase [Bacteroidales bacterium]
MTVISKNTIILNEVCSANNYANNLIVSKQAVEGTVVLAYYQTKGKGQHGSSWESESGKNVLMSIILFPGFLAVENQFMISKIASLALADFLRNETDNVSIKWPNDLYIGNKKIAGILIENNVKGHTMHSSVLGIGLNVNQKQFISNAPNPVSLTNITGKYYDIEILAAKIYDLVFRYYSMLKEEKTDQINLQYFDKLFRKNTWAKFRKEGLEFEARIIGIGKFGQLQLENRDNTVSEYMFKEIEYVI